MIIITSPSLNLVMCIFPAVHLYSIYGVNVNDCEGETLFLIFKIISAVFPRSLKFMLVRNCQGSVLQI